MSVLPRQRGIRKGQPSDIFCKQGSGYWRLRSLKCSGRLACVGAEQSSCARGGLGPGAAPLPSPPGKWHQQGLPGRAGPKALPHLSAGQWLRHMAEGSGLDLTSRCLQHLLSQRKTTQQPAWPRVAWTAVGGRPCPCDGNKTWAGRAQPATLALHLSGLNPVGSSNGPSASGSPRPPRR